MFFRFVPTEQTRVDTHLSTPLFQIQVVIVSNLLSYKFGDVTLFIGQDRDSY